jgi:DNA-binding NtrC family response regulator
MMNGDKVKLFLVDDDAVFLKSLQREFLAHANFDVQTFSTGESCITALAQRPDLIILDYHLDGIDKTAMDGMETLDRVKALYPEIPVVMLSSQDKIDVAVTCMHHRAFDYVVKSETAFMRLQKIIISIFQVRKMEKQLTWYMERM